MFAMKNAQKDTETENHKYFYLDCISYSAFSFA